MSMVCDGLLVGGLRQWIAARAPVFFTAALLVLAACGNGEGKKRAVECQTTDDCDASTLGECDLVSCEENLCVLDRRPDGHRCDDADPLTGEDACVSGICAGVVMTCDDDLGPCLKAVHDPETDECTVEPVDDETPCDDDDACTQVDTCQAGACVGAEAKTCAASDACHVDGECDPKTGECNEALADDETPCDDSQACTTADVCREGACAGEPVTCDDGLTCSVDSCDEKSGACTADMAACSCVKDADCQDGNACNGQEICGANQFCQAGTPIVCAASADACLKNVCVAETGACEPEPVADGAACDDADACTTRDTCQAGACAGKSPVVCAALSQCHLPGTCNKITGACSNPEKPKNSSCNDGNACTASDTCQAGACVGAAQVSCTAADQCHDVGVCSTATGICSKPSKLNGVKCDDANPCTTGDSCQNGACAPASQVTCVAQDSCHTVGACDVKTGLCSNPARPDGSTCSDGLTCTKPDSCVAGKCTGTGVVCDDKIACTVDSCSEQLGGCTVNATACPCKTSADCNDGNSCNGVETCNLQTLQCQKGTNIDCSALNDACNVGSCSAATGACVAVPRANGTACDDGNLCTQASSCQAGICQGTNPVTCAASDQCHDAGTCNTATGACVYPVKTDGTTCTDGNACTQTDTCLSGVCTGKNAVVCSALDQCHTAGTCNTSSGACSNPAKTNGTGCNDTDKCTQTDTCQGGICAGATVTCSASDQCHTAGTCDGSTGTCSNPVKMDGSTCTDGNACTQTDTCVSGSCTGASPVLCKADQCHIVGTCDTTTGVCSTPQKKNDGTACDDSNKCTKTDTCVTGVCTGASPVTCSASDQCHNAGTCDTGTGLCSNPNKPDNTACGDGKACTGGDKCTGGVCGGTAVTCDDKIACTVDSCAEPGGCNFDTSKCGCTKDADCVDADACNGVETCDLTTLTCKRGTAVNCAAFNDACNTGTCDSKTGACKATPKTDGTGCDDANVCTRNDGCAAGKCVGANPVTCSAIDQCHAVGTCDKATGICSNPNATDGTGCVDGNACTRTDTCKTGACVGANPVTCSALDQCHTVGTCDTSTGVCSNPVRTGSCDDGSACSLVDACLKGVCTGGSKRVNANGDWADDPGAPTSLRVPIPLPTGPLSVDLFTDKSETVHVVGTYAGALGFDDKNVIPPAATLGLGLGQETGIYWARYTSDGVVISADNLGGVTKGGTLTVSHATAHRDGSFSLLGTIFGTGEFGINGKTKSFDASKGPYVYVVHYLVTGEFAWLAYFSSQSAFTADSIAAFDDGSVIAIGANAGSLVFNDAGSKAFASADKPGIWAARLDPNGGGQWAGTVVVRGSTTAAQAVTTHEDGSASLTGGFTGTAGLGPNGEVPVSVGVGEKDRDIWFEKLGKDGKLVWGGRVGGAGADIPGDVAPIKGGGLLLLANTVGGAPNASDAKTTQQLHATPAGLQTHVLSIDSGGVLQSDGLIANPTTGVTHGWQLKLDEQGFYALAGTFATGISFWSKVGFGADVLKNAADFSIKSAATQPGPTTLFLARVNAASAFGWAVQAGGDNSGMATTAWDVVLTAHASHSATVAGVFNTTATFGDKKTESLQAWLGADGAPSTVGGGYVVHLNSQAEYDYCP